MESRFLVETKAFVLLVLGELEEKRKGFLGELLLTNKCTKWLALTIEILMGFPGDKEFVNLTRRG